MMEMLRPVDGDEPASEVGVKLTGVVGMLLYTPLFDAAAEPAGPPPLLIWLKNGLDDDSVSGVPVADWLFTLASE